MKWVDFPERNKLLGKPENMTDEECGTLPVFCDGEQCISKWVFDKEDIEHINKYGYIWLRVLSGATQPPVLIQAVKTVFVTHGDC